MNLSWRQQLALLVVAITALLASFVRPTAVLPQTTYRYVYFFDISQSMNVMDVADGGKAVSRLELAKRRAIESLNVLPCDAEVGIGLFTGHRVFPLLLPVGICSNYAELTDLIEQIDWRMTWKARSEVAKGLYKGIKLLTQLDEPTRLLFFTDGHEAPPLHPDVQPKFTGAVGAVGGLIVGVGGEKPVPIPKFDLEGNPQGVFSSDEVLHVDEFSLSRMSEDEVARAVKNAQHLSSLHQDYLVSLADRTGLGYHPLGANAAFVSAIESAALGIRKMAETDLRRFFAAVALLAVLLVVIARSAGSAAHSSSVRRAEPDLS